MSKLFVHTTPLKLNSVIKYRGYTVGIKDINPSLLAIRLLESYERFSTYDRMLYTRSLIFDVFNFFPFFISYVLYFLFYIFLFVG